MSEAARARMVRDQLAHRGIRDQRVLAAMGQVPREHFVPAGFEHRAYEDCPLPIGGAQTISQPYMVARTCELAAVEPTDRVLEVGGGSGYQAAVLGALAAEVVSIERLPTLVESARRSLERAGATNVTMICGDGTSPALLEGLFDVIVVAAAAPRVAPAWLDHLAPGGRLVAPVGDLYLQIMRVIHKEADGRLREEEYDGCVFVPLIGEEGFAER